MSVRRRAEDLPHRCGRIAPAVARPGRTRRHVRAVAATGRVDGLGAEHVLDLQRTAGNAAVTSLVVQRKGGPPTLRIGSTGQDVVELQSALNHTDEVVTPLAVDGKFGPITDKAVRQFQAAHPPLVDDGIVGPLTRSMIDEAGTHTQDDTAVARKLFARGTEAYAKGKFAHAYDFLTRADELAHRPSITFDRAQSLRALGAHREQAIGLFEQYLAEGGGRADEAAAAIAELKGPAATGDETTDTEAGRALFGKGVELFNRGDYAHAYDEFTKAHQLAPRPQVTLARAQCLRRLGGRSEEAIALFQQYIDEGGGEHSAEATAVIAELKGPEATGDEDVDTQTARVLFMNGAALYAKGDYAHAYDELTKAYRLSPRRSVLFDRAQCLRMLGGRREEAIALYQEYVETAPEGPRARQARFYAAELRSQGAAPDA